MAVAMGVALPMATSLYSQYQDRLSQSRQEAEREQAALIAANERDRSQAIELHARLRESWLQLQSAGAARLDALCGEIERELDFVDGGSYGRFATGVIVATLGADASAMTPAAPLPLACACASQTASLLDRLQKPSSAIARRMARRDRLPLVTQLTDARDECSGSPIAVSTAGSPAPPWGIDWKKTGLDHLASAEKRFVGPLAWPASGRRNGGASAGAASAPAVEATDPGAVATRRPGVAERRMRVYIQIPATPDASIRCLQAALRQRGYIVPDVEVVGKRSPTTTQLRFVQAQESDAAGDLLSDLRQALPGCRGEGAQAAALTLPGEPSDFTRFRGTARPYHFELWIGRADAPPDTSQEPTS
ncbi:hypothetical protein [Tahibacter amnicola]|uniref:Uncharacterized protein n=1 Tax=Tahibacter amnicola TaxID=2976241 RepID=A0ABY6B9F6_9GAMM|nr:hypothetical protein [Tahibacter amnicola]UXI66309.1 hypothetical protein N4264_16300 [Tahibacter amnicola]